MNTNKRKTDARSQVKVEGSGLNNPQGCKQFDIHQAITDQILAAMEDAKTTGRRLWDSQPSLPLNLTTNKPYSGINILTLWAAGLSHNYRSPFWLTYKQAEAMGGQVRKGETSTLCVFFKPWESQRENENGETETVKGAVAKGFRVFNLDQIDGIEAPAPELRAPFQSIEEAERIMAASPAVIHIGGTQAFYRPGTDTIHLPNREAFINPEAFYSTAMHEMTHSSGHKSRLDRDFSGRFGTEAYAFEELIAELGSAFLNADLGILGATLPDHANYLTNWIAIMKGDKKAITTAAAQASKAHGFIKGLIAGQERAEHQDAA
jgi:antirestriction protein ArdC